MRIKSANHLIIIIIYYKYITTIIEAFKNVIQSSINYYFVQKAEYPWEMIRKK